MTKTNSALKPYSFTFPSLQVVHCGAGSIQALRFEIQRLKCHRVYVITGRTLAESTPYLQQLEFRLGDTLVGVHKGTQAHSLISDTLRIVEDVRRCEADIILSLGGGSVVDTAKMIALCIAEGVRQEDEVFDFRMQLKDGKPVAALSKGEAMPHIALPTTLSGAEFSSYAGATNERTGEKYQFKHCGIAPKVVIQDADLTQSTPAWLWASTGVRAIDHCVEAIYSTEHQPFSDALAIHALSLLSRFLVKSTNNPLDSEARRMCQSASCLSLYSLGNVMVGLSHAIGHQLGGRCKVPHGVTSCLMLPAVMDFNREASIERQTLIAAALGVETDSNRPDETAARAADAIREIVRKLGIKNRLRDWGVKREDLPHIADGTMTEFLLATNPREVVSPQEVVQILENVF